MCFFVKYCIFRYELAFVVWVRMDRRHHSQSDAVSRINECTLVTVLERFWCEEGGSLFGFLLAKYFLLTVCTLGDRSMC
jgi:hypothetical protein